MQEQPLAERKQRKSVAFSDGNTLIDENGEISTTKDDGLDKSTAASHTSANGDAAVDEVSASFDELALKKKKKKSKKTEEAVEDGDEAPAAGGDADFDLGALKKKKKKKAPKVEDFESKLAEAAPGEEKDDDEAEVSAASAAAKDGQVEEGDMDEGTGIWAHDASQPINYNLLLNRFFKLLNAHNPDLMSSGGKSYKIPPPQCLREGNKKTIFANIAEISKRMKRSEEHVTSYLFTELGTNGSTDGSRRLVIKGKFLQKQIENVLRRYIGMYTSQYLKRVEY